MKHAHAKDALGCTEASNSSLSAINAKHAADDFFKRPNVELSSWEVQVARGGVPPEGQCVEEALGLREFLSHYEAWKVATLRFETAVNAARNHLAEGCTKAQAQAQALELARSHCAFVESSRPFLRSAKVDG